MKNALLFLHLDLTRTPYVLYGVEHIGAVSLLFLCQRNTGRKCSGSLNQRRLCVAGMLLSWYAVAI